MSPPAYLLFALLLSSPASAKELICPVVDVEGATIENGSVSADAWREEKVEATPREAGRRALTNWRNARDAQGNMTLDPFWLDRFSACMKVSGMSFSELVENPTYFAHVAGRTLEKNLEDIREKADVEDVSEELEKFQKRVDAFSGFSPDFKAPLSRISDEEKKKLTEQAAAVAEKVKDKCSEKDFSAELGPVRNQDDISWCYAYTAADLVTYHAKKSNAPGAVKVSALDLAMAYNKGHFRNRAMAKGIATAKQEFGLTFDALKLGLKAGYCPESVAPSEDYAYGSLRQTVEEIEGFRTDASMGESLANPCYSYRRTQELFPGIAFNDFFDILNSFGDLELDYFEKLAAKNCEGKRSQFGIKPEMFKTVDAEEMDGLNAAKQKKIVAAIDRQLDRGNVSSVDVMSSLLLKSPGAHAMVLVGRKFDKKSKTCKYLLRNSWGPVCKPSYHDGLCDADRPGHVWVKESELRKSLVRVNYIE